MIEPAHEELRQLIVELPCECEHRNLCRTDQQRDALNIAGVHYVQSRDYYYQHRQ